MLERWRGHPVAGPLVLVVLVLVLAMVFLHAAQDGHDAAADLGAACLGVVTFLALVLAEGLGRRPASPAVAVRGDRGPPQAAAAVAGRPRPGTSSLGFPLRR
jgi:hypothetical protein